MLGLLDTTNPPHPLPPRMRETGSVLVLQRVFLGLPGLTVQLWMAVELVGHGFRQSQPVLQLRL